MNAPPKAKILAMPVHTMQITRCKNSVTKHAIDKLQLQW